MKETVAFYREQHAGKGVGFYSDADWARIGTAFELVLGRSVLDVGSGNGAMLQALSRSGRYDKIAGVDVRRHSKLILPDGVDYHLMSVAALDLPDNSFDTVVCMEVLEHLEDEDYARALPELRRVARSRLVMTVPYNEPHPLWWHDKPGGHRQQFDGQRLCAEFPNAKAVIQPRPGATCDWVFLVEDACDSAPTLSIHDLVRKREAS